MIRRQIRRGQMQGGAITQIGAFRRLRVLPRGIRFVAAHRALLAAMLLVLVGCGTSPEMPAEQRFYQDGTPHTDRNGRLRFDYQAAHSFLPLALYHGLDGVHHGVRYDLNSLADAGFNAVHLWELQKVETVAETARDAGLQMIVHWPLPATVEALKGHPALLAWYLDEEPSFLYASGEMRSRMATFKERKAGIRSVDSRTPIIVLDGPPTETNRAHWDVWNRSGDIASHFNYPVTVARKRPYGPVERVAETTAIARELVDGERPLWMVLQAFGGADRGWHMPRPETVRAMAYAAIVHGATGLIYFALDSFVTRDDGILGIAAQPKRDYGVTVDYNTDGLPPLVVEEADLARSRALYRAVAALNVELKMLREAVLSPTSTLQFTALPDAGSDRADAVRVLLKRTEDAHILIAVNVDLQPASTRLRFARPVAAVTPLFGGPAPVDVTPDGWISRFAPESVGVFRVEFER